MDVGEWTEVKMFGGIGFMLNGHLLAGASSRGLLLRVGEERARGAREAWDPPHGHAWPDHEGLHLRRSSGAECPCREVLDSPGRFVRRDVTRQEKGEAQAIYVIAAAILLQSTDSVVAARPAFAPVWWPWSTVTTPLTRTHSMPVGNSIGFS